MRVLIAGGTGVIGRQLVSLLHERGHQSVVLARRQLRVESANPGDSRLVQADALDGERLTAAVRDAQPDVLVNLLTAIPHDLKPRKMAAQFAQTNRLRTDGTRNLAEAAIAVGAFLISESIAFAYEPSNPAPAHEDAPLWASPPREFRGALDAVRELERVTLQADGVVLRLGHLYGPGTAFDRGGAMVRQIEAGKLPLVGGGHATFSFLHAADAARAVIAAIDYRHNAAFNIVDDRPVRVSTWLPYLAQLLDAPNPKPAPTFVARLLAGGWGVAYLNQLRGASNEHARRDLRWTPRYADWHDGLRAELGGARTDGARS